MIKNKIGLFFLLVSAILSPPYICLAAEIKELPEFSKKDRVLILAPHPDDEVIGTGGLIQRAKKAGAEIKVGLFTNGDHNELAFIVYEKRITFKKREFIHMGEVRRKETLAALNYLGVSQDNTVFLGYPDFGTMEILTKYWRSLKPFKDFLTRISKVPYPEAQSPNALYVGENILSDLKKIITDFKPTKIFVSHPVDTNRDHRSLYLFLQVALWDLQGRIKRPEVFPYIVHVVGWPKPRGYRPNLELMPPGGLEDGEISWQRLNLTDEEIKRKRGAIAFYKSQIKAYPPYLFTFARKNELFGDYHAIKLKEDNSTDIQWQDIGSPEKDEKKGQEAGISGLAYAKKDKNLFVKLTLKRKINKWFGVSVFLLGYSKQRDFAVMPKIRLSVGIGGLHLKNKKQTLFIKSVQLKYQGKSLVIKVPLAVLGEPDYILSFAKVNAKDFPLEETAWRIIYM